MQQNTPLNINIATQNHAYRKIYLELRLNGIILGIYLNSWKCLGIVAMQVSREKNPLTFHHTGCLIGILVIVYYSPLITG